MKFTLVLLSAITLSTAEISSSQNISGHMLTCRDTGAGYITQAISIDITRTVDIVMERRIYSDQAKAGLIVNGVAAVKVKVSFNLEDCKTRYINDPNITLIACHTKDSQIAANLTLLDGSSVNQLLPNGVWFNVKKITTISAIKNEDTQIIEAKFNFPKKSDFATTWFDTSSCNAD